MDIPPPVAYVDSNWFLHRLVPPQGQVGWFCLDVTAELTPIFAKNMHTVVLDHDSSHLPIGGPGDHTLDLRGPKIPISLIVTTHDIADGGSESEADYSLGPSNPSENISLSSTESLTKIVVMRRF